MFDAVKLGNKIKILRKNKKWSLQYLSEKCRVSHSQIWGIEKGIAPNVSVVTMLNISQQLGTTIDSLLELDEDKAIFRRYNNLDEEKKQIVNALINYLWENK